MTKKDYVQIAKGIKHAMDFALEKGHDTAGLYFLIGYLATDFAFDNKLFDAKKFHNACGSTLYANETEGE